MSNQDSAEYTALPSGAGTTGVFAPYHRGTPVKYAVPFHLTVPNPSSAAPTLRLNIMPKGFRPTGVRFACEALSASAGVGLNISLGDSGSVARIMAATDCDTAINYVGNVAVAAFDYEYTADTALIGTVTAGKTPIAGTKIWGEIDGYLTV